MRETDNKKERKGVSMLSAGITAAEHDLMERQVHAKYGAEVADVDGKIAEGQNSVTNLQRQLAEQLPLQEQSELAQLDVDRGQLTNMQSQFTDLHRQFDLAMKRFNDSQSTTDLMKWIYDMDSWRYVFGGVADHLSARYSDFVDVLMRVYAAMSRLQAAIADSTIYARGAEGPSASNIAGDGPPSPQGWLTSQNQITEAENALHDVRRALDAANASYANAEGQIDQKADKVALDMDSARQRLQAQMLAAEEDIAHREERISTLRDQETTAIDTIDPVTP